MLPKCQCIVAVVQAPSLRLDLKVVRVHAIFAEFGNQAGELNDGRVALQDPHVAESNFLDVAGELH